MKFDDKIGFVEIPDFFPTNSSALPFNLTDKVFKQGFPHTALLTPL